MFSRRFFRGKLRDITKVCALDLGLGGSELADLYSEGIKASAGFLVLVIVLSYEP